MNTPAEAFSGLRLLLLPGFFIWLLVMPLLATSTAATPRLEWTKTFDASPTDGVCGVAADGSGHMYLCGFTYGSLFGSNPTAVYSGFLAKFDVRGNLLWGMQSPTLQPCGPTSITADASGNVYVGELTGVQKFNSSGVLQWTVADSSTANKSVKLDKSGNVYAGGYATLAKISPTGTLCWQKSCGFTGNGGSVAIDSQGNVFLAGYVSGSGSTWWQNGFVAKFDAAGNMAWNKQIGPAGLANVYAEADRLAIDSADNVYIAGVANQSLYGEAYSNLGYLMKWDTSGNRQSIIRFSASGGSAGGLCLDPQGGQYVLTDYCGLSDFNSSGELLWNVSPGRYQAIDLAVSGDRIWVVGNSYSTGFDFNVSCILVPEPAALAMLLSIVPGGLLLLRRRWTTVLCTGVEK